MAEGREREENKRGKEGEKTKGAMTAKENGRRNDYKQNKPLNNEYAERIPLAKTRDDKTETHRSERRLSLSLSLSLFPLPFSFSLSLSLSSRRTVAAGCRGKVIAKPIKCNEITSNPSEIL